MPERLADVPGCLAGFEAALIGEGVDAASLAIYLASLTEALTCAEGDVGESRKAKAA
jgi:hypothetical protein